MEADAPQVADSRPPQHGMPPLAGRLARFQPGLSRSFSNLSIKGSTGDLSAAALERDSPGGSSPSHSQSQSHSSSRRGSGAVDKGSGASFTSKLAGKLGRSRSEDGSAHGRNLFAAAAVEMASATGVGSHTDCSLQESRSFGNLSSIQSDVASLYRKASDSWNFGSYPTDAEDYELIEAVGEGATATVYLAFCPLMDVDVAVKIVNLDDRSINLPSIIAEVQTMKLLKHPNILPLYAAFLDDDQLWMVMPYVSGGSASDIMRRDNSSGLNEHCIATIMKPVCNALAYLHKDGYIHRDLKAGNILIDHRGQVILADMGVAAAMARSHMLHERTSMDGHDRSGSRGPPRASADGMAAYLSRTTFAGTPCWMAPEVMEEGQPYDCSADIWSFGITVLELALGQAPLQNCNLDQILMKTLNEPAPVLESADRRKRFTADLQDLVSKCLQKEPTERWTAARLLKHRFWKAAYDGEYLAKQLDIGTGAALATDTAARTLGRAIVGKVRQVTDKTSRLTGEEVDARDAFKLLRRVMLPPQWLPEDSQPLEVAAVRQAKGLAFGMLKSSGKGVKFFRGSGFVIGRSVNSRRETRWSAPSYFTMEIRGLPPQFKNMEEMHVVVVLPSWEALDRCKADETDFAPEEDTFDSDGMTPPGSPPKAAMKRLGKSLFGSANLAGGVFSHGNLSKLARRHTMDEPSMVREASHRSGNSSGRHSSKPVLPDRPEVGYGLEPGSSRPFHVPLQGARLQLDKKQNAQLYGEDATPDTILNIQKTKRPPPFDRLVKDIEQMVEGAQQAEKSPEDAQWFKNEYFFQ